VDVIHPADRGTASVTEFTRALQSGARDYRADYRVVWPDGRVRVMHSRGTIHRDAAGRVLEAVGTVQDVTERRLAEARIRQLNRVYAMLGGISEALVREKEPDTALAAACRITVNTAGFRMAWIGLLDDSGKIEPGLLQQRELHRRTREVLFVFEDLHVWIPRRRVRLALELDQRVVLGVGCHARLGGVDAEPELTVFELELCLARKWTAGSLARVSIGGGGLS